MFLDLNEWMRPSAIHFCSELMTCRHKMCRSRVVNNCSECKRLVVPFSVANSAVIRLHASIAM